MVRTLIIGLTGGIASGKSTIAKNFALLGVPIIDTDLIAKLLTEPNTPAFRKVVAHFGKSICQSNNNLDRKELRKIIFSNPCERIWLENLLHPLIYQTINKQIKLCNSPYCILVVPLLIETKEIRFRKIIDRILFIDAPKQERIKRLRARDCITIAAAKKIIQTQSTRKEYLSIADDVIKNNHELSALKKQVLVLHKKYSMIALDRSTATP